MLCCVDVDYRADAVVTACLGFTAWTDAAPSCSEVVVSRAAPAPYQPGQFYRRELPHLLDVLARLARAPEVVIVDGFVWLGPDLPGLGAHLHDALAGRAAVVGVAKRPYHGTQVGTPLLRGGSQAPLFVSAAGMASDDAVRAVASMHGPHRIPTLLKQVDRLARDHIVV